MFGNNEDAKSVNSDEDDQNCEKIFDKKLGLSVPNLSSGKEPVPFPESSERDDDESPQPIPIDTKSEVAAIQSNFAVSEVFEN